MSLSTEILEKLKSKSRSDQLEGMARYGITIDKRLGVSIPDIRKIAKDFGKNHETALDLWKTGYADAKITAALIDEPEKVTETQMEEWVMGIDSWDVCDQICMNLFDKTTYAWKKIIDWSERKEEFVKRTAFSLLACLACHDKYADDNKFKEYFPLIKKNAMDDRNYVKKAVSWSLRHIGKRNLNLYKAALKLADEIKMIDSKSAKWIGSDVVRDLNSDPTKRRLKIK
jgi:3-methyladenine DNA glycosylase AlkD